MRAAASRTFWTAGRSRPMRMAIIAITTNNSMSVKPRRGVQGRGMMAMSSKINGVKRKDLPESTDEFQHRQCERFRPVVDYVLNGVSASRCRADAGQEGE